MDNKSIFKASFSEITPLSDNNTIYRNVMERAKKMNKNTRPAISKAAIAAIAAAAVLAAATLTVGAVTGWDFNAAFGAIFDKHDEAVSQGGTSLIIDTSGGDTAATSQTSPVVAETTETEDSFNFEAYGKTLDLWYDLDGFSLNIKGISADKITAYLLYDVVFDEGYDCAPKEEWTDWYLVNRIDALEEGETEAPVTRSLMGEGLISQQGNVLSYYASLRLTDMNDTLQGKIITLDFGDLYRLILSDSEKDPEPWKERQLLPCDVHVEIPIDFDICTEANTLTLNESIEFHEYNGDEEPVSIPAEVKYFSYTPFSWELFIELDTSDFEKGDGYLIDLTVHFKDGSSMVDERSNLRHDENGAYYRSTFTPPIAPESIDHITVTEHTYY